MKSTDPSRTASADGAPAGMPARLWEAAKHGSRGTIPPWVRAAPDAGATAPPRIGQIARRAAQLAAAAGVVGVGIGAGFGAAEVASRPVGLVHPGDGAPAADHASTDPGTDAHVSSGSGDASGPPGSTSEGVTLHTSSDDGHLATGLTTTWRIPGHDAVGAEHKQTGVEVGHDGLTVEMYQDVVVSEGADGMFSVDAVEYVVVRDEQGHSYVFRDNYHTLVPDPPGQDTDLVVHETDRVQLVEHPDGSFSVTQADNSISVTVGPSGPSGPGGSGQREVTVTQTESVQLGHEPDADGHDTVSLTENEDGSTTSDQTEVATEQTVPPQAGETSGPGDDDAVPGTALSGIGGLTASPIAATAASSQVGTAPSTPGTFPEAPVMPTLSTLPPLATIPGAVATTAGGPTAGHDLYPAAVFAGLRGGSAEPGHSIAPAGGFPNELVPAQHPASGVFNSASGATAARPFEHPTTTEPSADAPGSDPHHGTAFAGHDQRGLDEPSAHAGLDLAVDDPTGPGLSADVHSAGENEEASGAHLDSVAASVPAASEHDPGIDTTVVH